MTDWTPAWARVGTSVLTAFLGSLVEFVEAMTILLAVGTVRGWPSAWTGAAAGVAVLTVLVVALGPALEAIPVTLLQLVVGALLLLIGTRWLWKAMLRSAASCAGARRTRCSPPRRRPSRAVRGSRLPRAWISSRWRRPSRR